MQTATERLVSAEQEERDAHRRAMQVLQDGGFEPMVGGAYALKTHTGIWRDTKDLDLFLRKDRVRAALAALKKAGYRTEFTDPLWIAKAFQGPYFVDLIFSSGNGIATVDEHWRRRAETCDVLGVDALVVPAEEMIWSKAFIQERERFDGADIHHLLRCKGARLDWDHLLMRFGERHWEVLLVHLITFRFSFPSEKDQVPERVMRELIGRMERREREPAPQSRICRGTLLSRQQYLHETNVQGYRDARELETEDWTGDRSYPVTYPDWSGGKDDAHRRRR
ncbi:MAG TPA: nucleotidyltransferase [Myxococcales bacterium]|nr:nucleotidyltransferase [Myxococcales bacterium]